MLSRRKALRRHRSLRRKQCRTWCQVYVLREFPGSPIRYVGQTRMLPSERMRWHFKGIHRKKSAGQRLSPVQQWIYDNDAMGIPVEIEVIDKQGIWDISEAVWIDRLRRDGHPLLNVAGIVA